jgi:hypothetical protein
VAAAEQWVEEPLDERCSPLPGQRRVRRPAPCLSTKSAERWSESRSCSV